MRKLTSSMLAIDRYFVLGCISNYYGAGWDFYNQGQTEKLFNILKRNSGDHRRMSKLSM